MRIVVFGLTISSSRGNGHATVWRSLCRGIATLGQRVFFERNIPYYASHRDMQEVPGGELVLYQEWQQALPAALRHLRDADVALLAPDQQPQKKALAAAQSPWILRLLREPFATQPLLLARPR